MFLPLLALFLQGLRATQPIYFVPVTTLLLLAAELPVDCGCPRLRPGPAFGPSARWFSYAAVCLVIYHLHFLLFGVVAFVG